MRTAAAIAAIAFVSYFAGSWFKRSSGPENRLPLGADATAANTGVRAPDISQLSPEERADRLFNRVMLLAKAGKADSVQFFAPMALNAYGMVGPLSSGQRYDMGRIAEAAGAIPMAMAQSDTILAQNPTHLLGLTLGLRVASLTGDSTARRSFATRLLAARPAESARQLKEYQRHAEDISGAIDDAHQFLSAGAK